MTGDVGAGDLYTLWGGAWDPHDLNRLVTAGGNGIQVCAAWTSPPCSCHCWYCLGCRLFSVFYCHSLIASCLPITTTPLPIVIDF